jgi:hypothetical protein
MENDISEFSYLWDGSSTCWALLLINPTETEPEYLIVDTEERVTLLISDNMTFAQVQQKMLQEGTRVVSIGNGW